MREQGKLLWGGGALLLMGVLGKGRVQVAKIKLYLYNLSAFFVYLKLQ